MNLNTSGLKSFKDSIIIFHKTLVLSIICDKCHCKYETKLKEKEVIEILKILVLINNREEYQMNI